MVNFTKGDMERQFTEYAKKYDLDLDGKSYKECIKIISNVVDLKSKEELYDLAVVNLGLIYDKFSFKGLRLFYHSYIQSNMLKSFTGLDALEQKYHRLLDDIKKYHNDLLNESIDLQLEYYIYNIELENAFKDVYGVLNTDSRELYSLMKVIHLSNYNATVIGSLHKYLVRVVDWCGGKYYQGKDLSDPVNLKVLYNHVLEENYMIDDSLVQGIGVFDYDDGYGNRRYYDIDDGHVSFKEYGCIDDFIREW